MKDFNKPLRQAFFSLLNGVLVYDLTDIPVFDEKVKKGQDNNLYVVIGSTTSVYNGNFSQFSRNVSVVIDIVTKTGESVSRDIADTIAEQIFQLALPAVNHHGLPAQPGFQYLNMEVQSDRYLDFQVNPTTSMVRRLITFSITVNQI